MLLNHAVVDLPHLPHVTEQHVGYDSEDVGILYQQYFETTDREGVEMFVAFGGWGSIIVFTLETYAVERDGC